MRDGSIVAPHLLALALVAVGCLSVDRVFPKDRRLLPGLSSLSR
jgi:hypothetical protein